MVCACFGVGLSRHPRGDPGGQRGECEAIGKALRAGTNCGSCLPELKRLLADTSLAADSAAQHTAAAGARL